MVKKYLNWAKIDEKKVTLENTLVDYAFDGIDSKGLLLTTDDAMDKAVRNEQTIYVEGHDAPIKLLYSKGMDDHFYVINQQDEIGSYE